MKLRNNTGCLFENRNKRVSRDADFTGTIVIDDRWYRVRGWSRATRKSGWYVSLEMKLKQPKTVKTYKVGHKVNKPEVVSSCI